MFTKISSILISILVILLLVTGGFLYYQTTQVDKYSYLYDKEVKETTRHVLNIKALGDTLETYVEDNGNLVATKDAFTLTLLELQGDYKELFNDYEHVLGKKPTVVTKVEYIIVYSDTIQTEVVGDSSIVFSDSTFYDSDNWTKIKGNIPYKLYYRIKKDQVNKFEFKKALLYSENLNERGFNKPFVVSYRNGKRVNNVESFEMDSIMYRVQVLASSDDLDVSEISSKFNIDKDYIYKSYEDGLYKYMVGTFIPKENNEPIISDSLLDVYAKLITDKARIETETNMKLNAALIAKEGGGLAFKVTSKHKGVTFTDIEAAEIVLETSDANRKKISRNLRKPFSVGLHLGFGVMPSPSASGGWDYNVGPVLSVGVNWNIFQFGSSYKSLNKLSDIIE